MNILMFLIAMAGGAALSWELLWQIQASLALGVSAKGTAITIAITMGGMCLGSLLAGGLLKKPGKVKALKLYAMLELMVGLSGLLMLAGFHSLMMLDGRLYCMSAHLSTILHLLGITLLLGPPTMAMGASIPIFGLMAQRFRVPLSQIYAVNTVGAALGLLLMSFVIIPLLGIRMSVFFLASLNTLVCLGVYQCSQVVPDSMLEAQAEAGDGATQHGMRMPCLIAFGTGLTTFALEVAWFRSFRAAFQDTTASFAIVLTSVLIAIALGARLARTMTRAGISIAVRLMASGVAVLLITPVIERFDLHDFRVGYYAVNLGIWFCCSLVVIGIPMLLIATVFPALLDQKSTPRQWGLLNGMNTLGAVTGSLAAAWLLLPVIGFARTSWLAGSLLAVLGIVSGTIRVRIASSVMCGLALCLAVFFESGLGRDRFQGELGRGAYTLLAYREGPDSTIAVVEFEQNARGLMIDGFIAASEHKQAHYMEWMGRLPMVLHPDPRRALVIAFGTGQTANGVRKEGPGALDIVELSPAVLDVGNLFTVNEKVLDDPRVEAIVMDGRAWLRRTERRYDVVTLEPMPPHFAGVNALYSLEFYRLMAERLNHGAIVAQWVPYHLLPPEYAVSVSATFRHVFEDSLLWVDPVGGTGILVGRCAGAAEPLGSRWPGFEREIIRDLDDEIVRHAVQLMPQQLAMYCRIDQRPLITDDNQLLAYGMVQLGHSSQCAKLNYALIEMIRKQTMMTDQ